MGAGSSRTRKPLAPSQHLNGGRALAACARLNGFTRFSGPDGCRLLMLYQALAKKSVALSGHLS